MRIRTPCWPWPSLFLVGVALTWLAGSTLIAVRGQAVGPAPWPQAQAVSLLVDGGMRVEGWYLEGSDSSAVLLLHGIRSDRRHPSCVRSRACRNSVHRC